MVNYILDNYALYIQSKSPFTRFKLEKYSLHIKRTEELHFEKRGLKYMARKVVVVDDENQLLIF